MVFCKILKIDRHYICINRDKLFISYPLNHVIEITKEKKYNRFIYSNEKTFKCSKLIVKKLFEKKSNIVYTGCSVLLNLLLVTC